MGSVYGWYGDVGGACLQASVSPPTTRKAPPVALVYFLASHSGQPLITSGVASPRRSGASERPEETRM